MTMRVVLAEKPSVARDIARCLRASTRREGFFEGNGWTVTWALGHLVELEEPEAYQAAWKRWSLDALPMIPTTFRLRPRENPAARKQLDIVRHLLDKADEIVCATDAGREGELIFRYILRWAGAEGKPFKRLWVSSLTDEALREGFASLRDGRDLDPLFRAARCRSEADWIVGINATRFFTLRYGRARELLSVGRVQTPVLAMIVNRDAEIEAFKPADYWELHTLYRGARFRHTVGKIAEKEKAEELLRRVQGREFEIAAIRQQRKSFSPPLLYDLTELQRDMNKRWGLTAEQTLAAAQRLYEHKHITYPRTDSRYLGSDMKGRLAPLLERLKPLAPEAVAALDLSNLPVTGRIINDAKVTDHHAIIPTNHPPPTLHSLSDADGKVYGAVLIRFIAAFHPACIKSVTTVDGASNNEPFRTSGTEIVHPGWQALYPHLLRDKRPKAENARPDDGESETEDGLEDQILPVFQVGERGPHEPAVKTLRTKPPRPFTEASLLLLMETAGKAVDDETLQEALKDKGIGTPATRAAIIEVLLSRGYIVRRGKNLLSTDAGRDLVRIIVDRRLKSPELTGEWEWHLKQIEQSKYPTERFMEQVVEHTRAILRQTGAASRGPRHLGACPKCDGFVIEGNRGYGCTRWKTGCAFVVWKDQFGTRVTPDQMEELLRARRTADAIALDVDGKRVHGRLVLSADHTLSWERVGSRAKVQGRSTLGACPLCGSDVAESEKAYGCSNWRKGCRFVVWRTMAHRKIAKDMVRVLLRDGVTPFIQKFKNKDGRRFDARLKLTDGAVRFDFTPNRPASPESNAGSETGAGPG